MKKKTSFTKLLLPPAQYIFNSPFLAALLVGTAIHLFFYISQLLATGHSYFDSLWSVIKSHPLYGICQIVIPYLVPFLVAKLSATLSNIEHQKLMYKYVEMNPDVVILLDENLGAEFANPRALIYLRRLNLRDYEVEKLLPGNYRQLISSQTRKNYKIAVESRIQDRVFSFSIRRNRHSPNIFITGRDSTDMAMARKRLEHATQTFQQLTSYLDEIFNSYDPTTFDIQNHYTNITRALMLETDSNVFAPTHLLMGSREGEQFKGNLYTQVEGEIIKDEEPIEIDLVKDVYRIVSDQSELVYSNWEDENQSLDQYQEQFNPNVRRKVGIIERFVTYYSGSIAVIAFSQGKKVDSLDNQIIKGFTVITNSLKRISEESKRTQQAFNYTMDALARASEANDEDTGDHIIRLNEYAKIIAIELNCDDLFIRTIHRSAQMHDVGKIHVNPAILKKPGKLSTEEFETMKMHPVYGAKILGESPYLSMAAEIALCHQRKI